MIFMLTVTHEDGEHHKWERVVIIKESVRYAERRTIHRIWTHTFTSGVTGTRETHTKKQYSTSVHGLVCENGIKSKTKNTRRKRQKNVQSDGMNSITRALNASFMPMEQGNV